jgi:hypothetical protein
MQASSENSRLDSLEQFGVDVSVDEEVSISLPKLKYGYRTTPMTWPELFDIIEKEKDFEKLSRKEAQQREYEIFRFHLRRQYKSIIDYILCTKFSFGKTRENGLWQTHPQLADISEVRKVLVPNDFPYYMADGIVHYILWKTKMDITQQDIEDAQKELRRRMEVVDILHWVNPPHVKSLPEIDHVHFLCLLNKVE